MTMAHTDGLPNPPYLELRYPAA